jgi:hypothetical protein
MVNSVAEGFDDNFRIGEISGQVSALRTRVDRLEDIVTTRLDRMDVKLDSLMQGQAERQGAAAQKEAADKRRAWFVGTSIAFLALCTAFLSLAVSHSIHIGWS